MREILFRGKRVDNGEWVYGFYNFTIFDDGSDELMAVIKQHIIADENGYVWSIDKNTVGQFTGLTDKNGTKIFEGDMFSIEYNYNWREIDNFEVVFSRSYGWILRNKDGVWFPLRDKIKYKEVIGNIHERENDE